MTTFAESNTLEPVQNDKEPHSPAHGHYRPGNSHQQLAGESAAKEAVKTLLLWMGQNPDDNGLKDTPGRVVKALAEMTGGYREDPKEILSRVFEDSHDEMIVLKGIAFTSLCEHHLLPFVGIADVGYVPGKVVGLSKLARLVDCYARRLQIQERMTRQIAEALQNYLDPKGVGVIVRAEHSCMSCRGVRKSGSVMVTSTMLGCMRDNAAARAEFMELCK